MKNSIILSSLFLLSFSSSFAMTDLELQKAMRAEIEPKLITLKKPKLFFHWVDASDLTPKGEFDKQFPANASQFSTYVEKQGKKIANQRSDRDHDIAGPGLYLASDPLVSRGYGGEKRYGLIVGQIKTGSRILPNFYDLEFSKNLVLEFEKRGCTAGYGVIDLLDTTDTNCTKIKQLFVGKDASFIDGRLYQWSSQAASLPGCSYSIEGETTMKKASNGFPVRFETIVAYNKNLFSEIVGFTHKSTANSGSVLANNVLSYLKALDAKGMASRFKLISDEQRVDSKITKMNDSSVISFTKNNIFGCH